MSTAPGVGHQVSQRVVGHEVSQRVTGGNRGRDTKVVGVTKEVCGGATEASRGGGSGGGKHRGDRVSDAHAFICA